MKNTNMTSASQPAVAGESAHTPGREIDTNASSLRWLVVNPEGKLLAVLDSESEAYWFTRNRGHANAAVYFRAGCDYAVAPELLTALRAFVQAESEESARDVLTDRVWPNHPVQKAWLSARAAIARAEGRT